MINFLCKSCVRVLNNDIIKVFNFIMYLKNKKLLKIFFLVFFIFFPKNISAQTFQNIYIPCEVEKCKPEWGPTNTRWYKGDGDKKNLQLFGMVVEKVIIQVQIINQ